MTCLGLEGNYLDEMPPVVWHVDARNDLKYRKIGVPWCTYIMSPKRNLLFVEQVSSILLEKDPIKSNPIYNVHYIYIYITKLLLASYSMKSTFGGIRWLHKKQPYGPLIPLMLSGVAWTCFDHCHPSQLKPVATGASFAAYVLSRRPRCFWLDCPTECCRMLGHWC